MKNRIYHSAAHILLSAVFCIATINAQAQKPVATQDNTCEICERIYQIDTLISYIATAYWPGLDEPQYRAPLFYFTDSNTYMTAPNAIVKKHFRSKKIQCSNKLELYKLARRVDKIPFHMSNQTDIAKKRSPYYRNPVMFCSDVAAANRIEPDISNTEEWLAIVLHEYFHAFQLKHSGMMNYLADSLKMGADTLITLYRQNEWLKNDLKTENDLLLRAIATANKDSMNYYIKAFLLKRKERRAAFKTKMGYDIAPIENFWEKMEGPARYVEYHLAYIYNKTVLPKHIQYCDTFFNEYKTYKQPGFEKMAWMHDKTLIMPAYYYVTGFNMCRALDKCGVNYKKDLFDNGTPLSTLLEQSIR